MTNQWKVCVRRNVIKGQWNELFQTCVCWEHFSVLAWCNGNFYLHVYQFGDDWEKANRLVKRIEACPDFTPEGKPHLWVKIVDTRPIRPYKRQQLPWWVDPAWARVENARRRK